MCNDGLTQCGTGASATCVDTTASDDNCGACGTSCKNNLALSGTCKNSACECAVGYETCDGACVKSDTAFQSNPANCGKCGTSCGGNPLLSGFCVEGTCTCAGGLEMCGTSCLDTKTDENHCGKWCARGRASARLRPAAAGGSAWGRPHHSPHPRP